MKLDYENLKNFYENKVVLITGNTGFKGSWLTAILLHFGAKVIGYSLNPPTKPNLFELDNFDKKIDYIYGDVRDLEALKRTINKFNPEIIFHLAAQPLVLASYENPQYTFETNIMGTVNILEAIRTNGKVKSFLNVTTDKVYENNDDPHHAFKENEPLNGFDPYSNSKSCSELVTSSYKKSFFNNDDATAISTARAGNVIGGGDFSENRIIPDCVRALMNNKIMQIRNPNSVRPYQHVLEPLFCYLLIAYAQFYDKKYSGSYNIGPLENDSLSTIELVKIFAKHADNFKYANKEIKQNHEAEYLRLDCQKMRSTFNWEPCWNIETAVIKTVEFTKALIDGEDVSDIMSKQIQEYINYIKKKEEANL